MCLRQRPHNYVLAARRRRRRIRNRETINSVGVLRQKSATPLIYLPASPVVIVQHVATSTSNKRCIDVRRTRCFDMGIRDDVRGGGSPNFGSKGLIVDGDRSPNVGSVSPGVVNAERTSHFGIHDTTDHRTHTASQLKVANIGKVKVWKENKQQKCHSNLINVIQLVDCIGPIISQLSDP